jgi:hypothetical protein
MDVNNRLQNVVSYNIYMEMNRVHFFRVDLSFHFVPILCQTAWRFDEVTPRFIDLRKWVGGSNS